MQARNCLLNVCTAVFMNVYTDVAVTINIDNYIKYNLCRFWEGYTEFREVSVPTD